MSTPCVRVNQVVNNEVLLRNEVLLAFITANTGVRTEDQSRRDLPERYNRGMMRRAGKTFFTNINNGAQWLCFLPIFAC